MTRQELLNRVKQVYLKLDELDIAIKVVVEKKNDIRLLLDEVPEFKADIVEAVQEEKRF